MNATSGEAAHGAARGLYRTKPAPYFEGIAQDLGQVLPGLSGARILEIGCGSGATGHRALGQGLAAEYVGVEMDVAAAAAAESVLSRVVCGNVEEMDLGLLGIDWDAIVCFEVLEHLVDPWSLVGRLAGLLRTGGALLASSPNVAHWRIIRELLRGRFTYEDVGPMDRTHLRWFTPDSFAGMFEEAGLEVRQLGPVPPLRPKARLFDTVTRGRFRHVLSTQIAVQAIRP